MDTDVLVVGASVAGWRTVEGLRAGGFDGRLTLLGEEPHTPYVRHTLSKGYLTGKLEASDLHLSGFASVDDLDVEVIIGSAATGLDAARRVVHTADRSFGYDELVVATGARPRSLPAFVGVPGCYVLRSLDDAARLRAALFGCNEVVVIGAGFVGSEVASAARDLGVPVTVLEAMASPLGRAVAPAIGTRLGGLHAQAGSQLLCGVTVQSPFLVEGALRGVLLADGTRVPGDLVVVGVGSAPNLEWTSGAGLRQDGGVVCDRAGRVKGVDHIHALGDVARWDSPRFGTSVRVEHWTSAEEQAHLVALDLLGRPLPAEPVPFVWSDHFGHRIQIAGRSGPEDDIHVIHDEAERYLAITGRDGRLASVVAMDDPRGLGRYRRLIARDSPWGVALAASGG